MPRFASYDGTELAYSEVGTGPVLVCIPGGPGQAVEYLGDLGGLAAHRTLILLDNRGTGASAVPADPASYRVDRLVADVEALRHHLGLSEMDLFGHSASGGVCLLYAAAHPQRVRRLILVDPSLRVTRLASDVGVDEVIAERAGQPWHADALEALHAEADSPEALERLKFRSAPFLYGRWDETTRAHAAAEPAQFVRAATDGFYAGFTPDPGALRAGLATLAAPVLLIVGEHDIWPTRAAVQTLTAFLPHARIVVQPGAGHFPWVDDGSAFGHTIEDFLGHNATHAG